MAGRTRRHRRSKSHPQPLRTGVCAAKACTDPSSGYR
jgi:hypothetical protein